MLFDNLSRPVVFAHRGDRVHAPENTLAAFELALQSGADAIEFDTMLCADGVPVVIHDRRVDRTTDGTGMVKDLSLADLRRLDAGSWFGPTFKNERIPTLEEVLAAFGQAIILNIELIDFQILNKPLPLRVAKLIQQYDLSQRVMISSFNPLALIRFHRLLPQVPIALNAFGGVRGKIARSKIIEWIGCAALHPVLEDATPALVNQMHRRGIRVHPHTVNHVEDMLHMVDLQVDGFFTDDPTLARRVLANLSANQ